MKSAKGYSRDWHKFFFYILSSSGHFIYSRETILAVLVGSHLGNIPERSELH